MTELGVVAEVSEEYELSDSVINDEEDNKKNQNLTTELSMPSLTQNITSSTASTVPATNNLIDSTSSSIDYIGPTHDSGIRISLQPPSLSRSVTDTDVLDGAAKRRINFTSLTRNSSSSSSNNNSSNSPNTSNPTNNTTLTTKSTSPPIPPPSPPQLPSTRPTTSTPLPQRPTFDANSVSKYMASVAENSSAATNNPPTYSFTSTSSAGLGSPSAAGGSLSFPPPPPPPTLRESKTISLIGNASSRRAGLFKGFHSFRNSTAASSPTAAAAGLDDSILKQSALRRPSTVRGNPRQSTRHIGSFVRTRTSRFGSVHQNLTASHHHSNPSSPHSAGSHTTAPVSSSTPGSAAGGAAAGPEADKARATYRRYRVGENVLVCNTQSRWANLVNRYGYPPGGGGDRPEEHQGPYVYVMATVQKVHFEEDAEYYTVKRKDTGAEQRADAEWMEPLRNARAEAAAFRAATESQAASMSERGLSASGGHHTSRSNATSGNQWLDILECIVCLPLTPLFWFLECLCQVLGKRMAKWGLRVLAITRRHGKLLLNGMKPYSLRVKLTFVNFLVLCSVWFIFIDQARLAFFPASWDYGLAIISCIVWIILVLELLCEVFIRPTDYHTLIASEKAYAPSTVRFINTFHLAVEFLSLAIFLPEFLCLVSPSYTCGDRPGFSYFNAAFMAILGPSRHKALFGRAYFAFVRLRVFGLVRHWRKMWINNTYVNMRWNPWSASAQGGLFSGVFTPGSSVAPNASSSPSSSKPKSNQLDDEKQRKENALINASSIGTALTVTNSYRALIILCAITGLFPMITTLNTYGGTNRVTGVMTSQLQALNLELKDPTSLDECLYYTQAVESWITGVTGGGDTQWVREPSIFLLFLSIEPVRCESMFPTFNGVVTHFFCETYWNHTAPVGTQQDLDDLCAVWYDADNDTSEEELASRANIRSGTVGVFVEEEDGFVLDANGDQTPTTFRVTAKFNHSLSVAPAALSSFLLQLLLLVLLLGDLSVLRRDSQVLALGPLRRMLKIVAQYAKNPLSTVKSGGKDDDSDDEEGSNHGESSVDKLGNFETGQLINAVSKITDLLRKCWGVAGADIISTNLATQEGALTEVFNPTVPGKSVYALFGFAAINGFDHTLRQLGGDVMILINDVAAVLHGEVFRWGFGDSGQCNKNLGAAFLMVFRIGLVKEVIQKLEQATDVVFNNLTTKKTGARRRTGKSRKNSSHESSFTKRALTRSAMSRRKNQRTNSNRVAMSLSLQSLPGISQFTDRAVIGMLKSFAGIYRDNKLLNWKNDFRLGAGVGAFSVNMIFGMDAGWAVEGAVGSEYKIDATYLSPHVNMASRMMSACKQYGVSILLSQAVQELMSDRAKSKLRHLDTVTVKGSSLKQKIFTYDARHKGVDFFLFSRSDEQADLDSDRYSPSIWDIDQDLRAMRQHVTEDFEKEFNKGRDAYLAGEWPKALKHLETANEIMVENVMDQGYIQDELNELQNRILDGEDARLAEEELRNETGDGPSRRLIAYMESENGIAPDDWDGYRSLTSK